MERLQWSGLAQSRMPKLPGGRIGCQERSFPPHRGLRLPISDKESMVAVTQSGLELGSKKVPLSVRGLAKKGQATATARRVTCSRPPDAPFG